MLGKLSWKNEAHCRLDLPAGNGRLLIITSQAGGLLSELFKDVVDEGIHDAHGLGGDACVRVHLLQHLEDVDLVGLDVLLSLLLLLEPSSSFSILLFLLLDSI